jgi:heme/copper-type cytochrome/quinol oxidase subunit 4
VLSLQGVANLFIYSSVVLGVLLLFQLWIVVPAWLFYSVLGGWCAYFATAIAVALRYRRAYPVAFILAIVTLMVSLPQPEHMEFVRSEVTLAAATFILGSFLQACVIASVGFLLFTKRKLH